MVKHCPKILASKEKARTKKATTSGHWCVPSPLSFQPHSLTFISISVFPVVNTSHCLVSLQMKRSAQNVLVSSVERFLSSSFFQLLVSSVVICLENLIICCFFTSSRCIFPKSWISFLVMRLCRLPLVYSLTLHCSKWELIEKNVVI